MGGGGVIFVLYFMLFPTFVEKINSGKKCVVLASGLVGGRSRATELPCLIFAQVVCNALPWALDTLGVENIKCSRSVHHYRGQNTVTSQLERNHPTYNQLNISPVSHKSVRKVSVS